MALHITCECGVVVRGDSDDELVENARQHAKNAHALTITREQALALAEPD
jgi:predicted small metal-binding protein